MALVWIVFGLCVWRMIYLGDRAKREYLNGQR
jgi:hypothetical protein